MAEYIDRQEAIDEVLSCFGVEDSIFSDATVMAIGFKLKDIPAADVQSVEYGEWTAEGNDEYGNYWDECTACRESVWFPPFVKNDYKYCPHCGAKMDGGDA